MAKSAPPKPGNHAGMRASREVRRSLRYLCGTWESASVLWRAHQRLPTVRVPDWKFLYSPGLVRWCAGIGESVSSLLAVRRFGRLSAPVPPFAAGRYSNPELQVAE